MIEEAGRPKILGPARLQLMVDVKRGGWYMQKPRSTRALVITYTALQN